MLKFTSGSTSTLNLLVDIGSINRERCFDNEDKVQKPLLHGTGKIFVEKSQEIGCWQYFSLIIMTE